MLAYTAYVWLLGNAPLSLVTTYAYVNPLVAVLLGVVLLGEAFTARTGRRNRGDRRRRRAHRHQAAHRRAGARGTSRSRVTEAEARRRWTRLLVTTPALLTDHYELTMVAGRAHERRGAIGAACSRCSPGRCPAGVAMACVAGLGRLLEALPRLPLRRRRARLPRGTGVVDAATCEWLSGLPLHRLHRRLRRGRDLLPQLPGARRRGDVRRVRRCWRRWSCRCSTTTPPSRPPRRGWCAPPATGPASRWARGARTRRPRSRAPAPPTSPASPRRPTSRPAAAGASRRPAPRAHSFTLLHDDERDGLRGAGRRARRGHDAARRHLRRRAAASARRSRSPARSSARSGSTPATCRRRRRRPASCSTSSARPRRASSSPATSTSTPSRRSPPHPSTATASAPRSSPAAGARRGLRLQARRPGRPAGGWLGGAEEDQRQGLDRRPQVGGAPLRRRRRRGRAGLRRPAPPARDDERPLMVPVVRDGERARGPSLAEAREHCRRSDRSCPTRR